MNLQKNRITKKQLKVIVLILLTFNLSLLSYLVNINDIISNSIDVRENLNPKSQDISNDNIYTGIGAPLNITHWANRTDVDLTVNFDESEWDTANIPLGSGWDAYKLNIDVDGLRDNRNWINGSFSYGIDDGSDTPGADDTNWISNKYENWTFGFNDTGLGTNLMSGNYLSSVGGHDCLELRMDSNDTVLSGWSTYDPNDRLWWNSSVLIPRGKLLDSVLNFELYPNHLAGFNSWAYAIYINDICVYSIGTYTLLQYGQNIWHSFSIPQDIWINTTNVFPNGPINNQLVKLRADLECVGGGNYSGFTNEDYQRLYFDNLELVTLTQAMPSNLGLSVNQTVVQDIDWGKGRAILSGNWQNTFITANFSSNDVGLLGPYSVNLKTDLNLFALKDVPETNYETNTASIGTNFQVNNNTNVIWEFYGFIAVPTGYSESQMKIEFPSDMSITSVFAPDEPSTNILNLCDDSISGILSIPINTLTSTPDGFWKFKAVSPNYCEELSIYGNSTGTWLPNNEFKAGDFINISAKITNSPVISSYIQNTIAQLQIRFPNGSLWAQEIQHEMVALNGFTHFDPIRIPSNTPNYEVGEYEAIVSWNNSFSLYGMNETGIIYKTFRVIHYSKLTPDQNYFENYLEGTVLNLKISFNDKENFAAIENAIVYTYNFTHPSIVQYFNEVSPGFYILEFNTIGGLAGNNTVTIYANSTNYVNTQTSITIDIIKQTTLTVDNDFFTNVPYKSNFSIQFNYTEYYTGGGIDPTSLSTNWAGDFQFKRITQGMYNLVCNASGPGYDPGKLYTLLINVAANNHVPQSIPIRVLISELNSRIKLYINGTEIFNDELISVEVWQEINVTVKYTDAHSNPLSLASVKLRIGEFTRDIPEIPSLEQYSILINATELGQGIDYLSVYANSTFYNPQFIRAILQITERLTQMRIFLNNVEKTSDPFINIPIGEMLNITIKYLDTQGHFIDNALLSLSGDYSDNLTENPGLEQYTILINSTDLKIGVKIITISAEKFDFQYKSEDLRIVVNRIQAEIISEHVQYIVRPGANVKLEVKLNNTDFGGLILGANVKYSGVLGTGDLIDSNGDGIYEAVLENIPLGTYKVYITAFAGDNYEFKTLSITITAIIPEAELTLYLILLLLAIGITAAIGIYIYLYRRVLRFPKKVRTVRKYAKTLNKGRAPRAEINSREKLIKDVYQDEVDRSTKILKRRSAIPVEKPDKFIKKLPQEKLDENIETK
ncbi:MAG: hypothetical protein ACFFBH_04425 [Promethearchaeota archaeon]